MTYIVVQVVFKMKTLKQVLKWILVAGTSGLPMANAEWVKVSVPAKIKCEYVAAGSAWKVKSIIFTVRYEDEILLSLDVGVSSPSDIWGTQKILFFEPQLAYLEQRCNSAIFQAKQEHKPIYLDSNTGEVHPEDGFFVCSK